MELISQCPVLSVKGCPCKGGEDKPSQSERKKINSPRKGLGPEALQMNGGVVKSKLAWRLTETTRTQAGIVALIQCTQGLQERPRETNPGCATLPDTRSGHWLCKHSHAAIISGLGDSAFLFFEKTGGRVDWGLLRWGSLHHTMLEDELDFQNQVPHYNNVWSPRASFV